MSAPLHSDSSRGSFKTRIGFVLALAGSAVGLGNIWKFPFEVADGGGATFIILYILLVFIVCFPIVLVEISVGRGTVKSIVGAFAALGGKGWRIAGFLGILCAVGILSYYNVVAGWSLAYFWEMLGGNFDVGDDFGGFTGNVFLMCLYSLAFMTLTCTLVIRGVRQGIERASMILMPMLFVIVLLIIAYSLTLPQAWEGVRFYLVPQWEKLEMATLTGAMRQAFFSLSLGVGTIIAYGSYLKRNQNILSSGLYVTFADFGIAFIAGFMIFPLLSFKALNSGITLDAALEMPENRGSSLIFVVLPHVFEHMGSLIGRVVGSLFFLLLSCAALTSTVSLLEVPVSYLIDEWKLSRRFATLVSGGLVLAVGALSMLSRGGNAWLTKVGFMDILIRLMDVVLLFSGMAVLVLVLFFWGVRRFSQELAVGNERLGGIKTRRYLRVALSISLASIFILVVLILVDMF